MSWKMTNTIRPSTKNSADLGPGDQRRVGQRPAADLLGDQEDHLAAVERRDRQEVEHRQVDAQDAQEVDQVGQARAGGVVGDLRDRDRAAQALGADPALARLRSMA